MREENRNETSQIAVRVLFFGAARDAVGQGEIMFSLDNSTNAASAFAQVLGAYPALRRFGRSLLFAVNEEYARPDREVYAGDELAVFPSVSGGSQPEAEMRGQGDTGGQNGANTGTAGEAESAAGQPSGAISPASTLNTTLARTNGYDFFELTRKPIDVGAVARRVVLPECGATVTLDGYTREWTNGKRTLHLVYEAYPSMALREMQRLGREAHDRFAIAHIGIVHRTGRLEIGETSVVIAVSAPHRRAAFEACEWAIRELKRTVPIWKKEVFEDGEVWVEGDAVMPLDQGIEER
ncbi:MAG: molybdenum cofactor biosynthesis protein MoaE [Acidobacteria bacterium]|nr:molybdenum cofactor biosynthesis protein MoaE [Acidobacteriota bacterium]